IRECRGSGPPRGARSGATVGFVGAAAARAGATAPGGRIRRSPAECRRMTDIRWIRDREEWDRLLLAFPHCDLRQSHAWGEIRRCQGWEPLRVAALNGAEGVVAVSLVLARVPARGHVACRPRGPR